MRVKLEGFVRSIDGNRHRTNGSNSSHKLSFASRRNIDKANINSSTILGVVAASIVLKTCLVLSLKQRIDGVALTSAS